MNGFNQKQKAIIDLIHKGVISPNTKQGLINFAIECFNSSQSAMLSDKTDLKSPVEQDVYEFVIQYVKPRKSAFKSKIVEKLKRQNIYKLLLLDLGLTNDTSSKLNESIFHEMERSGIISINGAKIELKKDMER